MNQTEVAANSISIEQSIRSLTISPWASDHPQTIAKIWPKHDILLKSMQLSTVELYACRLIYMTGIAAPYTWVETIVWEAINTEPSVNQTSAPADYKPSWVHQLVKDLKGLYQSGLHKSEIVPFPSTKYLPHLEEPVTHRHKIGRVLYDTDTQKEQLATAATDIIRSWLHFPTTPKAISQCSLPLSTRSLIGTPFFYWSPFGLRFKAHFLHWRAEIKEAIIELKNIQFGDGLKLLCDSIHWQNHSHG
jgi:hypothetical protein